MSFNKPLNSILIKPTGAECNIDCTYCFYLDKALLYPQTEHPRMSDDVLDAMVYQLMTQSVGTATFGWQGGEPTMMGLDFYKRAVNLQKRYGKDGQNVGNGIQTNGLLLNEEWAEFFNEYHFLIGLSLDGPEHIHDHYRVTRNGKPTYKMVRARGEMLLKAGCEVNGLMVVNDYSADFGREIYAHHKAMGLTHQQFIPCIENEPDGSIARFSVSPEQYGQLLCDVFDCWVADFRNGYPTTSIRFFDSLFHTYVGMQAPMCTMMAECGSYVVVEHNGDVYSCDFYVENDWKLGNVMESTLRDMLNSPRQDEFGKLKADLHPKCQKCEWLSKCYGNCTKEREVGGRQPGDLNYFCESYLQIFRHADPVLRKMAAQWQEDQRRQQARVSVPQEAFANANRNDPCPCGSGRKYKKCCAA